MVRLRVRTAIVLACNFVLTFSACESSPTSTRSTSSSLIAAGSAEPPQVGTEAPSGDAGVWRSALLDDAMRVASSFESKSHVKVKSRMQREVAAAALEVGLIDRARGYADRIADWRRGEVSAMVAQALAEIGDRRGAEACLVRASEVAASTEGWMLERLTTDIAIAYALLGDAEHARQLGARVAPELTGAVEATLSDRVSMEELDRQSDAFDAAIATGSLDVVRSGVDGHFRIWARVRDDAKRSSRAERAIRESAPGLPEELRIGVRLQLADALAAAGRPDDCRAELKVALDELRARERFPDVDGPLARDVAKALARHGESELAGGLLAEMVRRYERAPDAMVDVDRADYLRALAEALYAIGDEEGARRAWGLALEAGAVNVNARPRAEDLCLTLLSMIRSGVEPSAGMRGRVAAIESGLKAPW